MNILLVEDERIQREALASIIKSNFVDVRIYEAASKKEAMKIINEKDIHLFFIDIHLKDSSGLELAKKIRQHENHSLTGIVFVTGELVHIIEAFKNIHCYDFIVKPYKEKDIINIVDDSGDIGEKLSADLHIVEQSREIGNRNDLRDIV